MTNASLLVFEIRSRMSRGVAGLPANQMSSPVIVRGRV